MLILIFCRCVKKGLESKECKYSRHVKGEIFRVFFSEGGHAQNKSFLYCKRVHTTNKVS